MKVQIKQDGTMEVKGENELEAYALDKWTSENFNEEGEIKDTLKFVVICLDYKDSEGKEPGQCQND